MRCCALLLLLLSSCHGGSHGGAEDVDGERGQALTIDPPVLLLTVKEAEGGAPLAHRFTARSPRYGDVTARCEWSLTNPRLGDVAAGALRLRDALREGGQALVVARFQGASGTAQVTVKLLARPHRDASAPPDAEEVFRDRPAGAPAPTWAYPLPGALLPRNLGGMNLQWRAAAARAFRVTLDGATFRQELFAGPGRCQQTAELRCQWPLEDSLWLRAAASSAGSSLSLTVAAAAGGAVAGSAPLVLHFSPEDVRGGLYYFSTSQWGLVRLPFGGARALPFLIGDRLSRTGSCIGCHSTTRDGRRVAAVFGGGDGYGGIVDGTDANTFLRAPMAVKDGIRASPPGRVGQIWNFTSYNPAGDRLISTWGGRMELRDGATGALIRQVPEELLGGKATMPEWSPDGRSIVFVRIPGFGFIGRDLRPIVDFGELDAGDWFLVNAGDLAILPYNDGAFGPATTVLPASERGEYHFYPSFSPDSRFLVFNSARHGACMTDTGENQGVSIGAGNCTSYDQTSARLRLIAARGGAAPIELARATFLPNKTTAWPRFSPFLQDGGRLSFITFSAKLDYGLAFVQPAARADRRPQIWMAAVDLKRAAAGDGQDPSFAPFWLPFQDLAERNHQAVWTHDVLCRRGEDCGAGFDCMNGMCVPKIE